MGGWAIKNSGAVKRILGAEKAEGKPSKMIRHYISGMYF